MPAPTATPVDGGDHGRVARAQTLDQTCESLLQAHGLQHLRFIEGFAFDPCFEV